MFVPTAVHAQMFARLKQFFPNKPLFPGIIAGRKRLKARNHVAGFFIWHSSLILLFAFGE